MMEDRWKNIDARLLNFKKLIDELPSSKPIEGEVPNVPIEATQKEFDALLAPGQALTLHSDSEDFEKKAKQLLSRFEAIRGDIQKAYDGIHKAPEKIEETSQTLDITGNSAINDIIEKTQEGDSISIPSGTYIQNVNFTHNVRLVGNGQVTLISRSNGDTIHCGSIGGLIEGIQFKYEGPSAFAAAVIDSGEVTFHFCHFFGSQAPSVIVKGTAKATFYNCEFHQSKEYTLFVMDSAFVTCHDCAFEGSEKSGIGLFGSSGSQLFNCKVTGNRLNGITISENANTLIQKCEVTMNVKNGIQIDSGSEMIMIRESTISGQTDGSGVVITGNARPSLTSNTIKQNSAHGVVCNDQCQVVSIGNTFSDSNENHIGIGNKAVVHSENDKLTGRCSYGVYVKEEAKFYALRLEANSLSAAGLAITGSGYASVNKSSFRNITQQAAILTSAGTSVEITDTAFDNITAPKSLLIVGAVSGFMRGCTFSDNSLGISCESATGTFKVDNCKFYDQKNVSISVTKGSTTDFDSVEVYGQSSQIQESGGSFDKSVGIRIQESKPTVTNSKFVRVAGTAIRIEEGSAPIFEKCKVEQTSNYGTTIIGSHAEFNSCEFVFNRNAIIGLAGATPRFSKCQISANVGNGCVIQDYGTVATFDECTISAHTAGAGQIVHKKSKAVFKRCTFFNNLESHIIDQEQGDLSVDDCEFYSSGKGNGIDIRSMAKAVINHSKIHNESSTSIVVQKGGVAKISNCEIYQCGYGISVATSEDPSEMNTNVEILSNHFHDNSPHGIVVTAGHAVVTNNLIENQTGYGIYIKNAGDCKLDNNEFKNNKVGNVARGN